MIGGDEDISLSLSIARLVAVNERIVRIPFSVCSMERRRLPSRRAVAVSMVESSSNLKNQYRDERTGSLSARAVDRQGQRRLRADGMKFRSCTLSSVETLGALSRSTSHRPPPSWSSSGASRLSDINTQGRNMIMMPTFP
jgi:hypothetical protein